MAFYDKNGTALYVGDHIVPDEGLELLLISEAYDESFEETCLYGQQVDHPAAFSILTQANLSSQWTKVETDEISDAEAVSIIVGGETS
ncbi:MAG: hypothetical protein LUH16_00555 [Clostridiales bacterium]|nr:hypothetical protein [Clostridiales bacterium]